MNTSPLEAEEQVTLIDYLEIKNLKFTAIPNSTFTKSPKQKIKNWKQGLRKGFPDLIVIVPCGDGKKRLVCIELKRTKGGVLRDDQKEWIAAIDECEQTGAFVCYGATEAIDLIDSLLKRKIFY